MTSKAQAYQIQSKWFRWLPFLSALAIGALAIILYFGIGIENPEATARQLFFFHSWDASYFSDDAGFVREMHRRMSWEVSYVAMAMLGIGAVLTGLWVIRESLVLTDRSKWLSWSPWLLVCIILIVALVIVWPDALGFQLARELIPIIAQRSHIHLFEILINLGLSSLVIPPLALSLAATAVLHVPACPSKEEAARVIIGRCENLDLILYVGAALLVAGTLEIRAFYLWGEAYLSPTEGKLYVDAARFVSTVAGEFFSFMLAFIYLPAAYLLRRSVNGVEGSAPPKSILESNWAVSVGRVAAILAPIIAGAPFAEYLKGLS